MITNSTGYTQQLVNILSRLQVPPLHDSAWIGPFEQLAGAGYSLLESERLGFSSRPYSGLYYPAVQCKIVHLLTEDVKGHVKDEDAFHNWLSRYYFNSGIQRVDFAAERLLSTFASLPCACRRAPEVTITHG